MISVVLQRAIHHPGLWTFTGKDVTSGLVNLGGNAQVFGTKPDGSLWRVAVQSPDSEDEYGN